MPPVRLMLVVSGLERGGAERQVVHLANRLPAQGFEVTVCALSAHAPLASDLRPPARLVLLPKRWRYDAGVVMRLAREMRSAQIDVAHAFLFDAEIATRLAARLAGTPVVIGSERNADYRRPLTQRIGQRLTCGLCDAVVANSAAGKRFAMRTLGLPDERVHVLPNGVDTRRFAPGLPEDRTGLRQRLGVPADAPLIGMAANLKPQKNHEMFLRVARRVLERVPRARFVCIGDRLDRHSGLDRLVRGGAGRHGDTAAYQQCVMALRAELGLEESVLYPGRCDNPPTFYQACDLTMLTSRHEGTPNVVLESMACGVPVVATDVADNATVVPDGSCGFVVPLDDDEAAAERVCRLLLDDDRRNRMGAAARQRACETYSLDRMAGLAAEIYSKLVSAKRAGSSAAISAEDIDRPAAGEPRRSTAPRGT